MIGSSRTVSLPESQPRQDQSRTAMRRRASGASSPSAFGSRASDAECSLRVPPDARLPGYCSASSVRVSPPFTSSTASERRPERGSVIASASVAPERPSSSDSALSRFGASPSARIHNAVPAPSSSSNSTSPMNALTVHPPMNGRQSSGRLSARL